MSKPGEIAKLIQTIANSNNNVAQVAMFDAKVVEVQEITCTVERQGLQYSARLCAAFESSDSQIIIKPKPGSSVLVGDLTNGLLRDLIILSCSDVEVVLMNGGELGGLVKIEELRKSLDSLKQYCESLKSAIAAGLNAVGVGTAASGTNGAKAFNDAMAGKSITIEDMEDSKILH